jgi:hypothetical protein
MKKTFIFLFVVALFLCACQPKPEPKTVNAEAEKAAVDSLFTKFHASSVDKNAQSAGALIAEDALLCGTDPSEYFNKKQLVESWEKSFADTTLNIQYTVDKRDIRLMPDGLSAVVIEQYLMPVISTKMMIRSIGHAVKNNDKWLIDFMSWNFITKNEEIAVIDKALEMPVAKKQ